MENKQQRSDLVLKQEYKKGAASVVFEESKPKTHLS